MYRLVLKSYKVFFRKQNNFYGANPSTFTLFWGARKNPASGDGVKVKNLGRIQLGFGFS
jgi:hypothetical protein